MLELIQSEERSATLLAPTVRLRVRPGDRGCWTDASREQADWRHWKAASVERGIPLDALVGVLLEYSLSIRHLDELRVSDPHRVLKTAAEDRESLGRIAPTSNLRDWVEALSGAPSDPHAYDELPEVVLPERLLNMLPHNTNLREHVDVRYATEAIDSEIAAALCGLTLHSWSLRAAISQCDRAK